MRRIALAVAAFAACATPALASGISIVAAENFYGDMARTVAGTHADVTSILSNPDQDPHMFEASAATGRALANASVVIENGADYDPWMTKLLEVSPAPHREVIVVAGLVGRKAGDNPHLWYDPASMRAAAEALGATLAKVDPANAADYQAGVARFAGRLGPLDAKIKLLRGRFAGVPVTASEPVFGDMADKLGLVMRNQAFQTAVMNDTEPSPADVAAFETDLTRHKVKVMLYNSQADDAAVKRLLDIATREKVPVVAITETEPAGKDYAAWMLDQLDGLQKALESGNS